MKDSSWRMHSLPQSWVSIKIALGNSTYATLKITWCFAEDRLNR